MPTCGICGEVKVQTGKITKKWTCRRCHRKHNKEYAKRNVAKLSARGLAYKKANPAKEQRWQKANQLKIRYGLSWEDFQSKLSNQNQCCALCLKPFLYLEFPGSRKEASARIEVDHCHISGRVRGLLHGRCNRLLGHAQDDPELLTLALEYVRKQKKIVVLNNYKMGIKRRPLRV